MGWCIFFFFFFVLGSPFFAFDMINFSVTLTTEGPVDPSKWGRLSGIKSWMRFLYQVGPGHRVTTTTSGAVGQQVADGNCASVGQRQRKRRGEQYVRQQERKKGGSVEVSLGTMWRLLHECSEGEHAEHSRSGWDGGKWLTVLIHKGSCQKKMYDLCLLAGGVEMMVLGGYI